MRTSRPTTTFIAGLLVAGVIVPAVASTVPDARDVPRIAVVARGDNPIDALAAGPVAAAAGGVVVLTPSSSLTAPAEQALNDFAPDLVVLAGGEAALSPAVFDAVDAAGPWETRRVAGDDRYETAAALAAVLAEFGVDGLNVSDAIPADDRTTYVQSGGTPEANGQALLDAVSGLPAVESGDDPWRVVLEAGSYDLGSSALTLPDQVHLIGAGQDHTTIQAANPGTAPDADAAAVVTGSGARVEHLRVTNSDRTGSVVVGIFASSSITLVDVDTGQNTNSAGSKPDSYGLVASHNVRITDSSLVGFSHSGGTGIGLLMTGGFGGTIANATLHTQSDATGAGIVTTSDVGGDLTVKNSLFRGFGAGQGFIHGSSSGLHIRYSDFTQPGDDGTVNAGSVTIGSSMRDGVINESGGTAECAHNFTSAMIFIDC